MTGPQCSLELRTRIGYGYYPARTFVFAINDGAPSVGRAASQPHAWAALRLARLNPVHVSVPDKYCRCSRCSFNDRPHARAVRESSTYAPVRLMLCLEVARELCRYAVDRWLSARSGLYYTWFCFCLAFPHLHIPGCGADFANIYGSGFLSTTPSSLPDLQPCCPSDEPYLPAAGTCGCNMSGPPYWGRAKALLELQHVGTTGCETCPLHFNADPSKGTQPQGFGAITLRLKPSYAM